MLKNKERIIQEKTEQIALQLKSYVDEMDALSETDDFTIDIIEKRWGELEDLTRQVYRELNDEMISHFSEKAIIKSKKVSIPREE